MTTSPGLIHVVDVVASTAGHPVSAGSPGYHIRRTRSGDYLVVAVACDHHLVAPIGETGEYDAVEAEGRQRAHGDLQHVDAHAAVDIFDAVHLRGVHVHGGGPVGTGIGEAEALDAGDRVVLQLDDIVHAEELQGVQAGAAVIGLADAVIG